MGALFDENMKKKLENLILSGKLWDVVEAYEKYPEARQLKIQPTGDTALHVAISDEWERVAEKMISAADKDTLAISNEQGDTALHLAARFGNTYLCRLISDEDATLVGKCNEIGETPLFSAVSSGKTKAFLYLHKFCKDKGCLAYGRNARKDGDTILHSAIFEEHFDVAYIIISEYPDLVNQVNDEGLSPLHILATKSSVFPSGLQLFGIRKLIYHFLRVRKLAKTPNLAEPPAADPGWDFHLRRSKYLNWLRFFPKILDVCLPNRSHGEEVITIRHIVIIAGSVALLLFFPFSLIMNLYVLYYSAKYISGSEEYVRLKNIKEKCIWSVEVMNQLIPDNFKYDEKQKVESPIFIAAKHGISEMVSRILKVNPGAILVVNSEKKNIIMLAVERRHTRLYEDLITTWNFKKTIFGGVDAEGNNLLHIAANLPVGQQFWRVQGAALHMQMEIKWYKFIKNSMPPRFFARRNKDNKTSKEIFQEKHQHLIEEGRRWLTNTSQPCSVVAALIATVSYATSATVPGGLKQDNGVPSLQHKPMFIVSATSSLVALSSSMISVVMFLGILTSNFKLKDFRKDLPYKLLLGLISLLICIVSMFISFFAGHYFVLKQEIHHGATIIYALLCFGLIFFTVAKFPFGIEIVWTTLRTKPRN